MNIIQNIMNMYKTDPIKFFMMIAIVYLLLNQTKVVENLKTDQVDLTAISTVSQLAQKWEKAVGIDNRGNVTFKKNVTNNGTLLNKGRVTINSDLNQEIGGNRKAQIHNGRILGNSAIFGPTTGTRQDTKLTLHSDGTIQTKGTIKVGEKRMHLINKHVGDNSNTNLNYNANDWVCIHAGMNLDWHDTSPGRIETFCYVRNGSWWLRSEIESGIERGTHRILCIPKKFFDESKISSNRIGW